MYDFHKVNKVPRSNNRGTGEAQLLEFKHVKFHRDHPDLLPEIKRKVTENQNAQHPMSAVEASPLGSQAVQDYNLNPNIPIESKFEVLSSSNSKLHTELQIVRRELKEEKDLNARYRHKTNQLVNLVKFMQDQLKDLLPGYKNAIDQANARMDASRHQQDVISRTSVVMQAPTGDLLSSTYPLNISPVDPSPPMVKVSDHDASSLGLMSDSMFNSSSTSLFSNSAQASPVIGFSPSMNSNNGMDLLRSPSNQGRRHSPSLSLGSIPQQQGLTSPVYGHHKHGSLPHANAMGIHNNPMASSSSFNQSTGHLSPTHTGHSSRGQQQGPSYGQSYPPHQTLPQYDNSVGHTNSPIGRTPKRPRKEGPNIGQFNFTGMQRGDDGGSVVDGGLNEEDVIRLTTDHHTLTRTRSASSLHSNQGEYYTPAHSPSTSISALDGEALTLGPQRSPSSINLASRPGSSAGPSSGSNSATQVPKIEETFVDVSLVTKIEQ
ncbi:hypothetical protein FRC02_000695 [Tulasnella sp. 418]|nr:hypothetical protein FRC02_000695 [Tulasnella sp. 418]